MNEKEELLLQAVEIAPDTDEERAENDQLDQEPSLLDRWVGWAGKIDL